MILPEDHDEQMRQRWLSRLAQERLDLSASVEATLEEPSLEEDEFLEAFETVPGSAQASQKKAIIPPRLTLQSRVVPALNPNARALSLDVKRSLTSSALPDSGPGPVTDEQNASFLARLAQRITSSLSAILVNIKDSSSFLVVEAPKDVVSSPIKHEPRNEPRIYESSLALPAVHAPVEPPVMRALPAPRSTETQSPTQSKLRVPKRPTKIRLEATSEQEAASEEMKEQMEGRSGKETTPSGSGIVEAGCCEVAVANARIKSSSVVMVMLAGDPGPVVVQYITLRPQDGFTVHLSAPAQAKTPFNYAILSPT